jgi:hypothetical protein
MSKTYTIYGRYRFSFGASSINLTSGSSDLDATNLISSLQQMWLLDGTQISVSCTSDNKNSSNYTYIAYSNVFGSLTDIDKSGLDVITAFSFVGTFNYTNTYGYIIPYNIYKSNAPGAFDSGNILNII